MDQAMTVTSDSTAVLIERAPTLDRDRAAGAFLATFSSPGTRGTYSTGLRQWFAHCDRYGVDVFEVRRPVVDVWLRHLEDRGLAPNTIATRLTPVKSFYGWCYDEELVDGNPAGRVKGPRQEHPEMPAMTQGEAHRFATAAEQCDLAGTTVAMHLMLLAGLRSAEVCGLDIGDLYARDWVQVVSVLGKGSKRREVELPPRVAHSVNASTNGREVGPLVLNDAGNRITASNLKHRVPKVAAAAGVGRHLSPHCLRRTFIQLALDSGASARDVGMIVGHATPATTAGYDRRALAPGKSPAYAVQMAVA